jgi:hypothetical protein
MSHQWRGSDYYYAFVRLSWARRAQPQCQNGWDCKDRWLRTHLVDDSRHCEAIGWSTRPMITTPASSWSSSTPPKPIPITPSVTDIILIGTSTLPQLQPFQQNTHEYSNLRYPTRLNQHHSLKSFWRSPCLTSTPVLLWCALNSAILRRDIRIWPQLSKAISDTHASIPSNTLTPITPVKPSTS